MKNKGKRAVRLALLLSGVLLLGGPMQPVQVFANLDPGLLGDDGGYEEEVVIDDYGDDDYVDYEEDEPVQQETTTTTTSAENQYQTQIDDINEGLEDLQRERQELEENLESIGSRRDKQLANLYQIDYQIDLTRNEIFLLEERIRLVEGEIGLVEEEIADKQVDIDKKQEEIDDSYDLLKKRLRVMQLNDDATMLGMLLGADSVSDFLARAQIISRIAEHDQNLMEDLAKQKFELEEATVDLRNAKEELQTHKEQVEADKRETEAVRETLNVQLAQANKAVQDMDQMEREYMADLEANKAKEDAKQAELESIYQKIQWSQNPYVGGEMTWPVPGAYNITSGYGWRFSGTNLHTGIDITYHGGGTHGADIIAANSGTVQYVNWSYTPGSGYGIYLIIDHGGGLSTLYAHCSNIVVSAGQTVTKGQKIAEVGNTGWSTGPHLHFEVRKDGVHQAPLSYLTAG